MQFLNPFFRKCTNYIIHLIFYISNTAGLTFKRDGKFVSIEQISTQELILKFTLNASITNSTRTISV